MKHLFSTIILFSTLLAIAGTPDENAKEAFFVYSGICESYPENCKCNISETEVNISWENNLNAAKGFRAVTTNNHAGLAANGVLLANSSEAKEYCSVPNEKCFAYFNSYYGKGISGFISNLGNTCGLDKDKYYHSLFKGACVTTRPKTNDLKSKAQSTNDAFNLNYEFEYKTKCNFKDPKNPDSFLASNKDSTVKCTKEGIEFDINKCQSFYLTISNINDNFHLKAIRDSLNGIQSGGSQSDSSGSVR